MRKDARLQLRVSEDLKREIQEYAERNNTDISTLVTQFFVRVLEDERSRLSPVDAEQV